MKKRGQWEIFDSEVGVFKEYDGPRFFTVRRGMGREPLPRPWDREARVESARPSRAGSLVLGGVVALATIATVVALASSRREEDEEVTK